jgi:hypothetical protein
MSPNQVLSVYVPRAAKVRTHAERYVEISTVISIISVESSIRWMVGRCELWVLGGSKNWLRVRMSVLRRLNVEQPK